MSERGWTRDQKIAAVSAAAAVAGIALSFIKPFTDWIGPSYWAVQPFVLLLLGALMGFSAARALDSKKLAAIREEYESPARKVRETVRGLTPLGKAVLSYVLASDSYVTITNNGNAYREACKLGNIGLLDVFADDDYYVGQPDAPMKAAVSVEARNALRGDPGAELAPYLDRLGFDVDVCVLGTFENSVSETLKLRQGAAISILVDDSPQFMRIHLFEALDARMRAGMLEASPANPGYVEVRLTERCREVADRLDTGLARLYASRVPASTGASNLETLEIQLEADEATRAR